MNDFFQFSRQLNINLSVLIVFIGLTGHSLTLFVYIQGKFRTNSSNIFMVCLAVIDSFYLIVHLFEDTIRSIIDLYPENVSEIISSFNIVDKNSLTCHLINYLRNVLRFISAYISCVHTTTSLYSSQAVFKKIQIEKIRLVHSRIHKLNFYFSEFVDFFSI